MARERPLIPPPQMAIEIFLSGFDIVTLKWVETLFFLEFDDNE